MGMVAHDPSQRLANGPRCGRDICRGLWCGETRIRQAPRVIFYLALFGIVAFVARTYAPYKAGNGQACGTFWTHDHPVTTVVPNNDGGLDGQLGQYETLPTPCDYGFGWVALGLARVCGIVAISTRRKTQQDHVSGKKE